MQRDVGLQPELGSIEESAERLAKLLTLSYEPMFAWRRAGTGGKGWRLANAIPFHLFSVKDDCRNLRLANDANDPRQWFASVGLCVLPITVTVYSVEALPCDRHAVTSCKGALLVLPS